MQSTTKISTYGIPAAIILGFGLIAVAIFLSAGSAQPSEKTSPIVANDGQTTVTTGSIRPVDNTDYIRGNPNAPIMIVEYSDYDCPFCKLFHQTMNQIMTDYGVTGKVAWVYRQLPLEQLHPNASRISEAAFCVADVGGNDAFWKFTDEVFNARDVNIQTDMSQLPTFAETAGVSKTDLTNCLSGGKFKDKIQQNITEGTTAGATGTPYSFIIVGNQQAVINGAEPYPVVKQIIDNLIAQIDGTGTSTPRTLSN